MRDIKFRIWSKKYKDWYPDNSILLASGSMSERAQEGGYILSQFTGLKDTNGKEIYEGDVIPITDNDNGVVVYDENEIGFVIKSGDDLYHFHQDGDTPKVWYEVIGNIYATPNLLK